MQKKEQRKGDHPPKNKQTATVKEIKQKNEENHETLWCNRVSKSLIGRNLTLSEWQNEKGTHLLRYQSS